MTILRRSFLMRKQEKIDKITEDIERNYIHIEELGAKL